MPARTTTGTIAALLLAALFVAAPASAKEKTPEQLALEGINKVLEALNLFMDSIPQYEAPEVLKNGDIIIRRKHKNSDKGWQPEKKAPKRKDDNTNGDDLEKTRL